MFHTCKKCGSWVSRSPHYDATLDVLVFRCKCGYSWQAEPLDRRKEEPNE
jgi:hypothetical protein